MAAVDENIEVVQAALQLVFSEHRLDQIDELFAADFIQHSPYAPPGGRDSLRQWWAGQIAVIPDLTTTVEQILCSGHKVAVFRTVQGTITNDIPEYGIKASGQSLMLRASDIFRVENGKIAEHWEVTDTGPLFQLAVSQLTGR